MVTVIVFLIVLAVLIFVHEFGHFIAAKSFGIRVDAFKLGFGPKIISWKKKTKHVLQTGNTEYGINLIPFGGYVKIFGEDPSFEAVSGPDAIRSFVNKKRWQQAIVLVAGVACNFIFAWLLYIIIFANGATAAPSDFPQYEKLFNDPRILVVSVEDNSPAQNAGMKMGDVLTEVKVPASAGYPLGKDLVKSDNSLTIENIQVAIASSGGNPVEVTYKRDNQIMTAFATPDKNLIPDRYTIGISMDKAVTFKLPVFESIKVASSYLVIVIKQTITGLYGFITGFFHGTSHLSDVTGPVGIAVYTGDALRLGFSSLLMFVALISVNLGVINLIPFPALDGGRTLFVLLESIIRRRIPSKFTNILNTVGFVLLMILLVAVTFREVSAIITKL